ncbi:xylulokinase [Lactonifactor longoviformis]|uniref:Xylulokinase n=1 Tax=Lactonifactor longoviformis DSM 17459 TaxID=1122155 RepID=A0A1M5CJ88_9CLOT|nr:FGGY-family carbohydrate kinase [Lactonifactor longoviformis]POP31292.1 xylulokinase [Lactonifactor longoviformis]SHF54814.1 xylulokinase [Lactonifactor longoviformis DSM 17459]
MSKYILAHDLGTSGNKATLFSEDGNLIGHEVYSYNTHYFNGTWVEQDADDWWRAVCCTSRQLIESTGVLPSDIAAVSFSGQMMGCLCVDSSGTPLRPSMIWADQRAQKQADQIEEHISQWDYYHIVGHRNTASYGIQKLMWIRDNEPEIYEQTYKTLNAKDYIVFRLTGKFYTEYSDGNSNGCFDLLNLQWSEELLSYAGIDIDKLPELKPSTFIAGTVTKDAAAATGLAENTPVVLGGGDGVAANVGAGSIAPGKTYSCMGTSAWITTTSEKPIFDEQMRTVTWAHIIPGLYAPNGTMQYAGGAYSWVKECICRMESYDAKLHGGSPYDYMNQAIQDSPIGANGLIFLPYLLGERAPRWDPHAKGAWIGLKPENTRGDLLRSVLEGITMNLSIVLDVLKTQVDINEILVLGGGAKGEVWRDIMANVYNARILVPTLLEEAGSMGAAVTGGVGVGLFKDFSAIDRFIHIEAVHEPVPQAAASYAPVKELFDECYYALRDTFKKMG